MVILEGQTFFSIQLCRNNPLKIQKPSIFPLSHLTHVSRDNPDTSALRNSLPPRLKTSPRIKIIRASSPNRQNPRTRAIGISPRERVTETEVQRKRTRELAETSKHTESTYLPRGRDYRGLLKAPAGILFGGRVSRDRAREIQDARRGGMSGIGLHWTTTAAAGRTNFILPVFAN